MPIHLSDNPAEWQTAYTKDEAFSDSSRHSSLLGVILMFSFLSVLSLILLRWGLLTLIWEAPVSLQYKLIFGLVLFIVMLVIFLVTAYQPAMIAAARFFEDFYRPSGKIAESAAKIINHRLYGKGKLPPPLNLFAPFEYIMVQDGKIAKEDKWPAWMARHLGGPLQLIIFDGFALYLERGNRFSRVVGPGDKVSVLEWYETIKYVVDLRPKVRIGKFGAWTKDGIKIDLEVRLECRIGDPALKDSTSSLVYPFDPLAVKKAIERHAVRWPKREEGQPEEFDWVDAAWGQVTGVVPGYIGSRVLDDLFIASRRSGQILSPEAVREIHEKINGATIAFGVYVTDFQIVKIDIPRTVEEHQKELWMAERQGISTKIDGKARAFNIRTREEARAEAQYDLILSIAERLEHNNQDGKFTEPLLLSLSSILDESLKDPLIRAYLAKETLDTLEQLQAFLDRPSKSLEKPDDTPRIAPTT
jgi:regulator of protease activity HflC (stomatin/prohibitin superfamily)